MGRLAKVTLCLAAVRTRDGVPYDIIPDGSASLEGRTLPSDAVVPRALPSKVAAALSRAVGHSGLSTNSVCVLVGSSVHCNRLGDTIVADVVRRHCAEAGTSDGAVFDVCEAFADASGTLVSETVHMGEGFSLEAQRQLEGLLNVSLVVFRNSRLTGGPVCTLHITPVLSAAHVGSFALATQLHTFMYVDGTYTVSDAFAAALNACTLGRRFAGDGQQSPPAPASIYENRPRRSEATAESLSSAARDDGAPRRSFQVMHKSPKPRRSVSGPSSAGISPEPAAHTDDAAALQDEIRALRAALADAHHACSYAEERAALLELRDHMQGDSRRSQGRSVAIADGSRLMDSARHESLAVLQREAELQRQLRAAQSEVAEGAALRQEMERALVMQSRTIAEAKRVIANAQNSI